ncbi:MAG: hypothetical protein LBQ98_04375, partial [Nitrososphaerota archaeon]|nr:hypothetical protein [Nitrososphaerota archaeon]
MIKTKNFKKTISAMLVLVLVMGCFVTVFTSITNAAPIQVTSLATLEAIPVTETNNQARPLDANGDSINGQCNAVRLWVWYDSVEKTSYVYLLVTSDRNNKEAITATIGTQKSSTVWFYKPGQNNPTYSLIKFTDVFFDADTALIVDFGSGGNNIGNGKIGGSFTLSYIRYFDDSNAPAIFTDPFMPSPSANIEIKSPNDFDLSKDGYTFDGWTRNSQSRERDPEYDPGQRISPSSTYTDLYAVWKPRTDLRYVVNYLEQDTNKVLATQKVVDKQTFGTDVTEQA